MRYQIRLAPGAERQLRKLQKKEQRRIGRRIDALAEDPRPVGVEKLSGEDDFYSIRVGDWRIIYTIEDDILVVLVLKVGHRRDIYRSMPS